MTTPTYFGYSDSSPKTTDAMRLEQAARRFAEKHGRAAVNAVVHPEQNPADEHDMFGGIKVDTPYWACRNYVYLAIEEAA